MHEASSDVKAKGRFGFRGYKYSADSSDEEPTYIVVLVSCLSLVS